MDHAGLSQDRRIIEQAHCFAQAFKDADLEQDKRKLKIYFENSAEAEAARRAMLELINVTLE